MHTIVNRSVHRLFRRSVLCPLAAFCAFLSLAGFATAKPVKFDIPAQPAADALVVFSKQSGMDVLYAYNDLLAVRSTAVAGEYEPDQALALLLKGTGFTATQDSGKFVVAKTRTVTTGSARGSLVLPGGGPAAGVLVVVRETGQSVETDKAGQFFFNAVAPGSHVLVARAEGYQPLHITDVVVKAGNELALSRETLHKPGDGLTVLEPFVVRGEAVEQLDKYSVYGTKIAPFTDGNADIPRTIDDTQPYYIFDAKTIGSSGASSLEGFLKQRLTMNASAQSAAQAENGMLGNTSAIDLRGLGTDKTLILVNGRRQAPVVSSLLGVNNTFSANAVLGQADLNSIPFGAIDRIEVLPSSASGIYGGSAIGGVINVIMKRGYTGGELRLTYDTPADTLAPQRSASLNYSLPLAGDRTRLRFSLGWSDAESLLLRDRREVFDRGLSAVLVNAPDVLYSNTNAWRGALPNIRSATATATTLTLKNNTVLPSPRTYVPAGTSNGTAAAALYAGLAANADHWNLDLPDTTQAPTGLRRQFGAEPVTRTLIAGVEQRLTRTTDVTVEYAYRENNAVAVYNPVSTFTVTSASPTNPFTSNVVVAVPNAADTPLLTENTTKSALVSLQQKLPHDWIAQADYTWSDNRLHSVYNLIDNSSASADILAGTLNVFVDTLANPLDFSKYYASFEARMQSTVRNVAFRAAGPLFTLPWGVPQLALGAEHNLLRLPGNRLALTFPLVPTSNTLYDFYPRDQASDSAHLELDLPLVAEKRVPLLQSLQLQLAARRERYTVDTGTALRMSSGTGTVTYSGVTVGGQPFFSEASYASDDATVGLKYVPFRGLTLRSSVGTAFLPPTAVQLLPNPTPSTTTTNVTDPKNNNAMVAVQTLSGGNPDLTPQNSRSLNAGVIWEPAWKPLAGLRFNAEYYRVRQSDAIGTLTAQTIVDGEANYPDRVVRNAAGTITLVDISSLNLYRRETEGYDLSVNYRRRTGAGNFTVYAVQSTILHLRNQFSLTQPKVDAVNYPAENGAIRRKANGGLTWEHRGWSAGWSARYFSSYRQFGSIGGPSATQRALTGATDALRQPLTTYTRPQGGDTISSQLYHDMFVGYAFDSSRAALDRRWTTRLRAGLAVQVGVNNVFNHAPPFDYFYSYYASPYGDLRLRSYWLNVKKAF